MEIIRELKSTYLSQTHFKGASVGSLLFLSLCALLSTFYWHHPLGEHLLAKGSNVFEKGEYYRLMSSLFIHGDLKHLLSNSFMLVILSFYVIQYYGFRVFYFYSILFGVLTNALTLKLMEPHIGLLGASGVVYFLWGMWLSLYVLIQRSVGLGRRFMKVVAVSVFLLIPSSFDPQVSYLAHGIGFGVGIGVGIGHFLIYKSKIRNFEHYKYSIEYEDTYEDEFGERENKQRIIEA